MVLRRGHLLPLLPPGVDDEIYPSSEPPSTLSGICKASPRPKTACASSLPELKLLSLFRAGALGGVELAPDAVRRGRSAELWLVEGPISMFIRFVD